MRIRPRPSRVLAAFLLATHALALGVVAATPLDWYWQVGLAAAVLAGLGHALATQVLFTAPWAPREAIWHPDGAWILTLVSGEQVESRLLPSTYVTPLLVVLRFRRGRWRSRSLVLLPDSMDGDLLRQLRVRLRLSATGESASKDVLA